MFSTAVIMAPLCASAASSTGCDTRTPDEMPRSFGSNSGLTRVRFSRLGVELAFVRIQRLCGEFMADVDDFCGAVKFETAACRAGHLAEQVGRVCGKGVTRQCRLRDVDGAVHHLEAAQPGH